MSSSSFSSFCCGMGSRAFSTTEISNQSSVGRSSLCCSLKTSAASALNTPDPFVHSLWHSDTGAVSCIRPARPSATSTSTTLAAQFISKLEIMAMCSPKMDTLCVSLLTLLYQHQTSTLQTLTATWDGARTAGDRGELRHGPVDSPTAHAHRNAPRSGRRELRSPRVRSLASHLRPPPLKYVVKYNELMRRSFE